MESDRRRGREVQDERMSRGGEKGQGRLISLRMNKISVREASLSPSIHTHNE